MFNIFNALKRKELMGLPVACNCGSKNLERCNDKYMNDKEVITVVVCSDCKSILGLWSDDGIPII